MKTLRYWEDIGLLTLIRYGKQPELRLIFFITDKTTRYVNNVHVNVSFLIVSPSRI